MANSKSTIYPVQLQGAELCLNKYDAEIKQYSGFNKNNSPFVGGCLSNLYKKTEQYSGDTYIAPNGDVWNVNGGVLYKNNEVVSNYASFQTKIEDVGCPDDAFFCFQDLQSQVQVKNFYAVQSGNSRGSLTFHLDTYSTISGETASFDTSLDLSIIVGGISHDVSDVKINVCRATTARLAVAINAFSNDGYCSSYLFRYSLNEGEFEPIYSPSIDSTLSFKNRDSVHCVPFLYFNSSDSPNHFYYCSNLTPENSSSGKFYILQMTLTVEVAIITQFSVNTSGDQFVSNNVGDLFFYVHYSNFTNHYFIKACSKLNALNVSGNVGKYLDAVFYFDTNTLYIDSLDSEDCLKLTRVATGSTMLESNFNYAEFYGPNVCYYTTDKKFAVGLCDFYTGAVELKEDGTFEFNTGAINCDFILSNNGLVTGVASPTGNILLTEWNNVTNLCFFVFPVSNLLESFVCWKDNRGKWVKTGHYDYDTSKLYVRGDYLIFNDYYYRNAVNLRTGKLCLYAPAWNDRLPIVEPYNSNTEAANITYLASAINEYDLQNCASIILNPLPSVMDVDFGNAKDTRNEALGYIDYYSGSSEILYAGSVTFKDYTFSGYKIILTELEGLSFPIATDGNVMMSPSLFAEVIQGYTNDAFFVIGSNAYQMIKSGQINIPSFYMGTMIEYLESCFIIQGQYYGVINGYIFALYFTDGIITGSQCITSVKGLQYCGCTPVEALFFSKTNKTIYSFNGANVLNAKQFVDKISSIKGYQYNPSTQSIFLLTNIGVLCYSIFGSFFIDYVDADRVFILNNGIVINKEDDYTYVQYYDNSEGFVKQNIQLETCFYGMNNQTVTINDCLYVRVFSEEHESGEIKIAATTISLSGRKTEETVFKFAPKDWDEITHTIYFRYQPKEQRGLGVAFSIDSPFKIASLSVGSQPDAILIDKVSKGAINVPQQTSNNTEW